MRQLARCDASLYGLLAVEVHCCLLEGLLAFCSRFSQVLAFHQVYFRFFEGFGLAACTKMFSTWDFRSAGAFPAFLLTELASLPAWQFAAGYAQLHGFALPHGAETARRCVKHSLLERPGPKGSSPLQAQGLFGSRMGGFITFCVSKVEKVSISLLSLLSLSLSLSLSFSLSLSLSLSLCIMCGCVYTGYSSIISELGAILGQIYNFRSAPFKVRSVEAVISPIAYTCVIDMCAYIYMYTNVNQAFAQKEPCTVLQPSGLIPVSKQPLVLRNHA